MARPPALPPSSLSLESLEPGERVLVATAERLGDSLFRQPSINLLARAYPRLRFDVLAFGPAAGAVFEHNPSVGRIHVSRDPRQIARIARDYALLINLRRANRKSYLLRVRIPRIAVRGRREGVHKTENCLEFVRTLLPDGFATSADDRRYRLYPQPEDFARAEQRLREAGGPDHRVAAPLVAMHVGCASMGRYRMFFSLQSFWSHRKAWPSAKFAELAQRLSQWNPQPRLLLLGSAEEGFLARRLRRSMPHALDLTGRLSVLELAALLSRVNLLVCNDSGPLHVGCAMGTPLVGLFGPTDPRRTGPYPADERFRVIQGARMSVITVEQVETACRGGAHGFWQGSGSG